MLISMSMRQYLSINHFSTAALFAKQCQHIEDSAGSDPIEEATYRMHKACATSSIIVSAAFLEATINEIFSDCADTDSNYRVAGLPENEMMGKLWNKGIPRTASYSILEKYEIALELNKCPPFPTGENPYQDIKLLVELRNALIHFEPETIRSQPANEAAKLHKFEKKFKGKFSANPLTGLGNAFYPEKLLGAGCAKWAIESSVAFTDRFFQNLGMTPTYEHVRKEYL